jgi:hypothetical protein
LTLAQIARGPPVVDVEVLEGTRMDNVQVLDQQEYKRKDLKLKDRKRRGKGKKTFGLFKAYFCRGELRNSGP